MRSIIIVTLILSAFFYSCDSKGAFEQNVKIPNEQWNMDSMAVIHANITDTTTVYNVLVNIRNTTDYPNSNLYLFITTHAPSGAVIRDTMECMLANDMGKWLGNGFGRMRDNQIPYKSSVKFPVTGEYVFEIQHGMRSPNLKGIASTGIRIERR
jgi:gliding motility-associated lipoprotein GldH